MCYPLYYSTAPDGHEKKDKIIAPRWKPTRRWVDRHADSLKASPASLSGRREVGKSKHIHAKSSLMLETRCSASFSIISEYGGRFRPFSSTAINDKKKRLSYSNETYPSFDVSTVLAQRVKGCQFPNNCGDSGLFQTTVLRKCMNAPFSLFRGSKWHCFLVLDMRETTSLEVRNY